jgi:hypothetical protein
MMSLGDIWAIHERNSMSANPYQKSTEYLTSKMPKLTREQALRHVRAPAIGLISVSGLALGLAFFTLLGSVVFYGLKLMAPDDGQSVVVETDPNETKEQRKERRIREEKLAAEGNFLSLSTVFVAAMSLIIVNAVVLTGAIKMLHLQRHPYAVTAAAMAIIPLLSPLAIVGIPFGVWAMIKLGNPEIKRYFTN